MNAGRERVYSQKTCRQPEGLIPINAGAHYTRDENDVPLSAVPGSTNDEGVVNSFMGAQSGTSGTKIREFHESILRSDMSNPTDEGKTDGQHLPNAAPNVDGENGENELEGSRDENESENESNAPHPRQKSPVVEEADATSHDQQRHSTISMHSTGRTRRWSCNKQDSKPLLDTKANNSTKS